MLITMHVRSGDKDYVTQHEVSDLTQALPALLSSEAFHQFAAATMPSSVRRPCGTADMFLFVPMDGLRNAWLAQGGHDGEYFTVVMVRTHEENHDDVEQGMKQTSVEHIGRSQLIPGVRRLEERS